MAYHRTDNDCARPHALAVFDDVQIVHDAGNVKPRHDPTHLRNIQ